MSMYRRNTYSIPVLNAPDIENETIPVLNRNATNNKLLFSADNISTVYESFLHGMKTAGGPTAPVFGFRERDEMAWMTYGAFHDRFRSLAQGLQGLGLRSGDNVGLFGGNCVEWAVVEYATYYAGLVSIAMHETQSRAHIEHILGLTEVTTVFATTACAKKLAEMRDRVPRVKSVVLMQQPPPQTLVDRLIERGYAVFGMGDVEAFGRAAKQEADEEAAEVAYDDVATIVFTSGTVDVPKGAVLTHGNLVAAVAGSTFVMENGDLPRITASDCGASILPLSHVLGRVAMHALVAAGCRTVFPRTQAEHLVDDIGAARPTVLVGVPRFASRVQAPTGAAGLGGALFRHAVRAKLRNMRHGQAGHWLWDHVLFRPLGDALGGRVRLIVAGSSSVARESLALLRCVFSCDVSDGYGMTETCGAASVATHDDGAASAGTPFPANMIKLASVKELGYTVDDKPYPRGEILVRGANVFRGYFRQPELTAEVLAPDGWFRTGDLGMFDDHGRLRIIDRKCNIFKLASGHLIEPERIEYVYCACDLVTQAFVYGDRERGALVAIIVLDPEFLRVFLARKKIVRDSAADPPHHQMLCIDTVVRSAVLNELNTHAVERDLSYYELLSNIYLEPYGLDVYGLLTPTLKIKRYEAIRHYQVTINRLYEEIESAGVDQSQMAGISNWKMSKAASASKKA
ncbi:medium-chain fatty acid-CoA ligase faa2 [Coemansia sp. BCRC 34490]|nr:medium-chain fatty acid-CoA ligase faa2 [Coemansia sp. BCRC 34490]